MNTQQIATAVGAVAIIGIAILGFSFFNNQDQNTRQAEISQSSPDEQTTIQNESETSMDEAANSNEEQASEQTGDTAYIDGEYTAFGEYRSPAGREEVEVSVVLADGVVEEIEFVGLAKNSTSVRYQTIFADNFEPLVIGQPIDEIELDKVSGSSLTSIGFNEAIDIIQEQAQS